MSNLYNTQNLQIEVAVLTKKILAFKPCYARINIPAIMDDNDSFIIAPMPVHLAVTYGDKVIPEGTKLLIQTVAGNYNDIKIVGYYNEPKPFDFISFIRNYVECKESTLPEDYGLFEYDEIK